jgi:hypothetical protein
MTHTHRTLVLAAAALVASTLAAQPRDSTKARTHAAATHRRTGALQPTARDRVGADSRACDDLCRRERRLDSLYGKNRERGPKSKP